MAINGGQLSRSARGGTDIDSEAARRDYPPVNLIRFARPVCNQLLPGVAVAKTHGLQLQNGNIGRAPAAVRGQNPAACVAEVTGARNCCLHQMRSLRLPVTT